MATFDRRLVRNKAKNIVITARDRQILQYCKRLRLITTDHIQKLTNTKNRTELNRRLRLLFDAGYLDRPIIQERLYSHADKRPLVHALGNKGAEYGKESLQFQLPLSVVWTDKNRKLKSPDFFTHTLGVSDFFVSLITKMTDMEDIRLVEETDVLAQAPANTLALPSPLSMPTSYRWFNGSLVERSTKPDGIFSLVDSRGDVQRTAFHFIEFDGNTMPVVRKTPNQSSIVQKMFGYADIYNRKLHVDRFGYKNFRVLFITHGSDRIKSMIDAYERHIRPLCPPGAFLFADYEDIMCHSPLGDVWVNGKGERTELVPGMLK